MDERVMRYFLFVFCLWVGVPGYSQLTQLQRYEYEVKSSDNDFTVIPMKESGIAMVRDLEEYEGNKKLWEVIILDTAFQERWNTKLPMENRLNLIGYEATSENLFLLFRTGETDNSELSLVQMNPGRRAVERYTVKQEVNFRISHFSMANEHALFGGYIMNEPTILIYSLNARQLKVVPGFFRNDMQLMDLRVNLNNTFNAVLIERKSHQRTKKLIVKTFDESGTLLLEDMTEIDEDHTALAAISSQLKRDELIIVGTWGVSNMRQAFGYFVFRVDPFHDEPIRFYDFAELDHFLNYEKPKRVDRIKTNAKNRRARGKLPEFKVHLNLIALEEYSDGFILQSEVYIPSSTINQNWNNFNSPWYNPYAFYPGFYSPGSFNRPYSYPYNYNSANPVNTVDDSRVLSSSLVLFSPEGSIKSDYQMTLNAKIPELKPLSAFHYTPQGATVFYKKEKELMLNIFQPDGAVTHQDTLELKRNLPTDLVRSESKNDQLSHWFGSHYFIRGYQTIRDNTRTDDRTREVFYLIKIRTE
jgi:hypothetical protein